MKISFVIIAYNEEANILACIESIVSLKGLSPAYEIIVVNDGSKDSTGTLVEKYAKTSSKIKLINQLNSGRGAARAKGISNAKGELVATVDGDIVLPPNWLLKCSAELKKYDAASATPIPDGDVAFIYQRFHLKPKVIASYTTINGSNALYKGEIFSKIQFDKRLKEGEDTDFNYKLTSNGYKLIRLSSITVLHNEKKSFHTSLKWLYQYGYGATRHLKKFRRIRTPDIAFFCFLITVLFTIIACIFFENILLIFIPIIFTLLTAAAHFKSKFIFNASIIGIYKFIGGWATDFILINCYYIGRIVGLINWKNIDVPSNKGGF